MVVKGFPIGGNSLSTTQGIVSRIEYAYLRHRRRRACASRSTPRSTRATAAARPWSTARWSAWSTASGRAENVGYVIPNEEIDDFLSDVADGRYDGKPRLFEQFQTLENEALRARLGLAKAVRGIMVREPRRRESSYPLKEFDVVTAIGDNAIDNEGMVQVRDNLRLSFLYLVPKLARDGTVPIRVRPGRPHAGRSACRSTATTTACSAAMTAGSRLTSSAARWSSRRSWRMPSPSTSGSIPRSPAATARSSTRRSDRAQVPGRGAGRGHRAHASAPDDQGLRRAVRPGRRAVNGTRIKNLRHLVETIRDCKDEFLTFRFAEEGSETLVFRRKAMLDATEPLMSQNGIPRRGSDDVLAVWDAKSSKTAAKK